MSASSFPTQPPQTLGTGSQAHPAISPLFTVIIHTSVLGLASSFPPLHCTLGLGQARPVGVLLAFRGPARANGSTGCSWTQMLSDRLRLWEPLVLQTQLLAIAEDRSSVGWETHHQFYTARGARGTSQACS